MIARSPWRTIRPVLARSDTLRRGVAVARAARERVRRAAPFDQMVPEDVLRMGFNVVLQRDPDPGGVESYLPSLQHHAVTPHQFVEWLTGSDEFIVHVRRTQLGPSLHISRCYFIRSLPRAGRILDLGGTHLGRDVGAFVSLGYPYEFEELVIIDLPNEDRHPLYQGEERADEVESKLGPVRYRYHSMTDLSAFDDESFDLVYSGQSIEHVTEEEGDLVLKEVARLLRPGGHIGLDTPNARVTRVQQDDFVDPDHKVEYTHQQMVEKFERAGLEVVEAKGLNYAGRSVRTGEFSVEEVAQHHGLFTEIEDCYLLAYVARKPA